MEEVGTTLGLLKPYVDTDGELSSDLEHLEGGPFQTRARARTRDSKLGSV